MKAARERPNPPAWSARSLSSIRAEAPRRTRDSTDIDTKGRAEDTCRYACRLEASRAAAANPGVRAAPPAEEAAAGWMTETTPTTSRCRNTNMTSPRCVIYIYMYTDGRISRSRHTSKGCAVSCATSWRAHVEACTAATQRYNRDISSIKLASAASLVSSP
jgi:hypothetical protein